MSINLVLEGGGMRCAFTSGVLDVFMENKIDFSNVYGVSAGAITGAYYVSNQSNIIQKTSDVDLGILSKAFNEKKELMLEKTIPIFKDELDYDYEGYLKSNRNLYIGVYDPVKDKMKYFEKEDAGNDYDMWLQIIASSSLPGKSPKVKIDDDYFYDGGMKEPIPVKLDGSRQVVILSQDKRYKKKAVNKIYENGYKELFEEYPNSKETILKRNEEYNDTLNQISELEDKGSLFVFRPSKHVRVKTFDKNIRKITDLYMDGRKEALERLEELKAFLNE